jgi:hypothetical protein
VLTVALSLVLVAEPCPDLPLRPGTTWTYAARIAWTPVGSDSVRDTALIWRTEVLAVRDSGAVRIATVRNWPNALAWWDPSKPAVTTRILCVGDSVFHLDSEATRVPGDDDLLFSFPLSTGKLYGRSSTSRDDTFYAWFVESSSPVATDLVRLGAAPGDSSFTVSYRTLPDHQTLVVIRGLGMVEYTYAHHGTVANAYARLVAFSRGR